MSKKTEANPVVDAGAPAVPSDIADAAETRVGAAAPERVEQPADSATRAPRTARYGSAAPTSSAAAYVPRGGTREAALRR